MPVESSRSPKAGLKHSGMEYTFGKKIVFTLLGILVAYTIVLVATMIRNNLQAYDFIGQADKVERTISVEGEGKVTAVPDVAVLTMGMQNKEATVAEAQKKNTETMNSLIGSLQTLGISKADIQTTAYNVYARTRYEEKVGEVPDGFAVDQSVTVKVRDLTKVGDVLAQAGSLGLNSVGGVQFKIDNLDVYRSRAREIALRKVTAKAVRLSQMLGVRLVAVVSYNEYEPGTPLPYDAGGPLYAERSANISPTIESGSNDVVLHVAVTYEIE